MQNIQFHVIFEVKKANGNLRICLSTYIGSYSSIHIQTINQQHITYKRFLYMLKKL